MIGRASKSIDAADLRGWCVRALEEGVGVPRGQAALVADSLVDADLRGIHSHGIQLLPRYVERVLADHMAADTVVTVIDDQGIVVQLDGGVGFGQVAAGRATELLVERAREYGVAMVGVRETTHFGALGYFTRQVAVQGFVALACQNGPPIVPAFGGLTPLLATNPLSYATPVGGGSAPIVFDAATTTIAGNTVQLARRRGDAIIPADWMLDAAGRPTTDLDAASRGFLQWVGGHKGYGLGLLVELLAGVLVGASSGTTERTRSPLHGRERITKGAFFLAIDPARFLPDGAFEARTAELVTQVHASARAFGHDQVVTPGEIETARREQALAEGIELESAIADALAALAVQLGVPAPGFRS